MGRQAIAVKTMILVSRTVELRIMTCVEECGVGLVRLDTRRDRHS